MKDLKFARWIRPPKKREQKQKLMSLIEKKNKKKLAKLSAVQHSDY